MAVTPPTVKLNNGSSMPVLGLGTYMLQGDEGKAVVAAAIDAGYRHFDTAIIYHSEEAVGEAIREKIADGTVTREEVFVTSKLWCTYAHPGLVLKGCKKTLENLGLDYVDLYLMHWPFAFKAIEKPEEPPMKGYSDATTLLSMDVYFPRDESGQLILSDNDYVDTWKEMEQCVAEGMAKSIGVSNFNSQQIERLLQHATIKPVVNEVECHPYLNQKKLMEFCAEREIVLLSYSSLSAGNVMGLPGMPNLFQDEEILKLAKEINKTPAQVILRFLIQLGAAVIPRTLKPERLEENMAVFDFTLTPEQMTAMESLDRNHRCCRIPEAESHAHYPFKAEF